MSQRPHNLAVIPSAPTRRTHGIAMPGGGAWLRGVSAKRCRFGHGPGFMEGVDV